MRTFIAAACLPWGMKGPLRKHFRSLRDAIPGPLRQAAARRISEHIEGLSQWKNARAVLLYASFGSEVDTRPLIEAAWTQDKETALPRIEGRELTIHRYTRDTPLMPNLYGIPEPPIDAPRLAGHEIGLVLVPGMAFDRRGARLGYGGGYYDRLLTTVSHAFRVGIAMDKQVVKHLPTTHLDVPMDVLVTDSGVNVLPKRDH